MRFFLTLILLGTPLLDAWGQERIRPMGEAGEAVAPSAVREFAEGFDLRDGDVIVFTGATRSVRAASFGYLETLLTHAASAEGKRVYFRTMAWQADTVFQQQRPRNFGSHLDQLNRVGATVVIAAFGQAEALGPVPDDRDRFKDSYRALLEAYASQTRAILLLGPTSFAGGPDSRNNGKVKPYVGAVAELAEERGLPHVGLFDWQPSPGSSEATVLLDAQDHWRYARTIGQRLLGTDPAGEVAVDESGAFIDPAWEEIRLAVVEKERLWQQHWRPSNWAFAYGNRQHVPSSHDHRKGEPRWFPAEVNAIIPMIEKAEDDILARAKEVWE